MKQNELVRGSIYMATYCGGPHKYLFRCDGSDLSAVKGYVSLSLECWSQASGNLSEKNQMVYSLPTVDDQLLFEACERAGKYVKPTQPKEDLITEARRRYPPGTHFKISKGDSVVVDEKTPYSNVGEPGIIWNGNGHGQLYNNGKWAEIVPPPQTTWNPQVGDSARIATLHSKSKSTLGGTVGHVGVITKIDNGYYYLDPYCTGRCWPLDCLEPATPITEDFKFGDFVEILDTANIRKFGSRAAGKVVQLTETSEFNKAMLEKFNKGETSIILASNQWGTNFQVQDLRKISFEEYQRRSAKAPREIFPGISIGDIVVSTYDYDSKRRAGDMFTVMSNSYKNSLAYMVGRANTNPNQWRKATPVEEAAYKSGIKNISQISSLKPVEDHPDKECTGFHPLVEEAKKRFPIGCTAVHSDSVKHSVTITSHSPKMLYWRQGHGCIYYSGSVLYSSHAGWAQVIKSAPVVTHVDYGRAESGIIYTTANLRKPEPEVLRHHEPIIVKQKKKKVKIISI